MQISRAISVLAQHLLERVTKQLGEETKAEARGMLLLCARDGARMLGGTQRSSRLTWTLPKFTRGVTEAATSAPGTARVISAPGTARAISVPRAWTRASRRPVRRGWSRPVRRPVVSER